VLPLSRSPQIIKEKKNGRLLCFALNCTCRLLPAVLYRQR